MPERRCTDDVDHGWVVRVQASLTLPSQQRRVPVTAYWHGRIGPDRQTGSTRLTPDVAVFDTPAEARAAMVAAAGWQPGRDRDHVIVPVSHVRAELGQPAVDPLLAAALAAAEQMTLDLDAS